VEHCWIEPRDASMRMPRSIRASVKLVALAGHGLGRGWRIAVQRLETVLAEPLVERDTRHKVEDVLAEALERHQEAEQRLRDIIAQQLEDPSQAPLGGKAAVKAAGTRRRAPATVQIDAGQHTATPGPVRRQTKAAEGDDNRGRTWTTGRCRRRRHGVRRMVETWGQDRFR
jgi:hypothetical protein